MELKDIRIKHITALETYVVRHPVLRAGRSLIDCEFKGDKDQSALHLGLFYKTNLIGVATYIKNSNSLFTEKEQYQLRGMAILKEFQRKGLGVFLLEEGEKQLLNKCQCIWFNARQIAVEFYESNGYKIEGDSFIIKDVGLHFIMVKKFFKRNQNLL